MAEIMTKCPVTHHAVSTGIDVASDADFNCLLNAAYHVNCPLCGGSHVWFKHDAWIADRPGTDKQCIAGSRRAESKSNGDQANADGKVERL